VLHPLEPVIERLQCRALWMFALAWWFALEGIWRGRSSPARSVPVTQLWKWGHWSCTPCLALFRLGPAFASYLGQLADGGVDVALAMGMEDGGLGVEPVWTRPTVWCRAL
jgi:hypothetical protein